MKNYKGFIGSYTRDKSRGIRKFTFNEDSFDIEDFYTVDNPTYLALDKEKNVLYSSMSKDDTQGVMSMNLDTGKVSEVLFKNEHTPAHISVLDDYLIASNYHDAHLDLYELSDHMVTKRLDSKTHTGEGPNKDRQKQAHIHFALKNPHNNDILACDLGSDRVHIYEIKDDTLNKKGEICVSPGSGPRHLCFSENENITYVFSELTSEVFVLEYKNQKYHQIQAVNTLPEDFQGENTGAAIRIHPNQKFIYVSNRGHDSISTLKIDDHFKLELVSTISCGGNHPRDFNLTPDGKYLLSAHMTSNDLTLFKVNEITGELSLVQERIQSPEPVSIVFL